MHFFITEASLMNYVILGVCVLNSGIFCSISSFLKIGCVSVVSRFSHVQLFVNPWTVAYQAPLSMGFSQKECWSGLLRLPPGDLPDPGMEPMSPASPASQVGSLPLSHRGSQKLVNPPY